MVNDDLFMLRHAVPSALMRTRYGVSEHEKIIVYHGSLNQFNRLAIQNLCVAIGLIRQRGVQCRLLRTGAYPLDFLGELPRETVSAISDLGMLPRGELPELLSLADVFVQPGTPSPFEDLRLPGKIAEFLAMGRPVVMPDTNIAGLFRDGVDVVLMQTGSPEEIASRCVELFTNPKRAAEIGRAGRLMAERHFDARVQARLLENLYKEALRVFDPVVARDVWKASAPDEPVALLLAQKLKLLAERNVTRADAPLLAEHARYIESMHHRITGLEASLVERDEEVASLKQGLAEAQEIGRISSPPASGQIKGTLNRLKTRVRRLANLLVID